MTAFKLFSPSIFQRSFHLRVIVLLFQELIPSIFLIFLGLGTCIFNLFGVNLGFCPNWLDPLPESWYSKRKRKNPLICLEGAKKNRKKLTNVSLYVCMSAGNSEMLVFISVFFPNNAHFSSFLMVAWEKTEKCQFLWSMYVCQAKTNICQFLFLFFLTFP